MNEEKVLNFEYKKVKYMFRIMVAQPGHTKYYSATTFKTQLQAEGRVNNAAFFDAGFWVIPTPTRNCQTACIGGMDSMIGQLRRHVIGKRCSQAIVKAMFIFIRQQTECTKRQFIVDYNTYYDDDVRKHFNLISSSTYLSTNNSNMTLGIILIPKYK